MLKKKKTEAITKATYRELPNSYLETIQKGIKEKGKIKNKLSETDRK